MAVMSFMKISSVVVRSMCRWMAYLMLVVTWGGRAWAQSSYSHLQRQPVVGIMGITDETELLASMLQYSTAKTRGGIQFISGTLEGKRVVLARVGYGKVNSAAAAAILVGEYDVDCVIFSGTAGALNPEFIQGDVIIGCDLVQHDLGQVTKDGMVQWLPTMPAEGSDQPRWLSPPESFMDVAREVARTVKLSRADGSATNRAARAPRVWEGIIVTGDSFMSDASRSADLRKRFGADAVEMEGASVAQVCYQFGAPCLVVRSITDSADGSSFMTYQQFVKIASENSARLVSDIIKRLRPEDLYVKSAFDNRQTWCLISSLNFASNSPNFTRYPGFADVPEEKKEGALRMVYDKMADAVVDIVPGRKLGILFEAEASGSGPVSISSSVIVQATRENARKMAAILAYLGQHTTVVGLTEAGPLARRALMVENVESNGWSNFELLRARWPQWAANVTNFATGFSRVKTLSSDGLIFIDRTGSWTCSDWYANAEKLKDAAGQVGIQVRVTRVAPSYFEVQIPWETPQTAFESLGKLLSPAQLKKVTSANQRITELLNRRLPPVFVTEPAK